MEEMMRVRYLTLERSFLQISIHSIAVLYCDVTWIKMKEKAVRSGKGVYTREPVVTLAMMSLVTSVTLVVRWSHGMLRWR